MMASLKITTLILLIAALARTTLLVSGAGIAAVPPTEEVGGWHNVDLDSEDTQRIAELAITLHNQKVQTPPLKFEGVMKAYKLINVPGMSYRILMQARVENRGKHESRLYCAVVFFSLETPPTLVEFFKVPKLY